MIHAVAMFGGACRFRDTKGLKESGMFAEAFSSIDSDQVPALHSRIIACDNLPGAKEVYGFTAGPDFTLLVGNERRGLSHEFARMATDQVHVPMISRKIDCLNVAAASAVALYYLCGPKVGLMAVRNDPRSRRPDLLLYRPVVHYEAGSTIRSAAAFGWDRAFVEDPHHAWFGSNRLVRSEARAAARRGKNEILLIPSSSQGRYEYERVTVVGRWPVGVPLHRLNLARGPGQLLILPDETNGDVGDDWTRFGREVEFGHLVLPAAKDVYHYRLIASIVLAEISRQVGRRARGLPPSPRSRPFYNRALKVLAEATGEAVALEDLVHY